MTTDYRALCAELLEAWDDLDRARAALAQPESVGPTDEELGAAGGRPMSKTTLSPAAQAVLDTMHRSYDHEPTRRALAAGVLRAAADQVVPADALYARSCCEFVGEQCRASLLAIAAELEGNLPQTPQPDAVVVGHCSP